MKRRFICIASALLWSSLAGAAEIKVLSTQATEEAYRELVPQFEKATGAQGHDGLHGNARRQQAAGRGREL
jgi:ABC-type molybdate transport system substrate-binding protein